MTTTVTLSAVVEELKLNREVDSIALSVMKDLVHSVNKFLDITDKNNDRENLKNEEDKRERSRLVRKGGSDGAPTSTFGEIKNGVLGVGGFITSILTGNILADLLETLAKVIWKPLAFLGRILLRNGPLAVLVTGAYFLLRDIGENKHFQAALDGIKKLWNDKIIPLFNKVAGIFADITSSKNLEGALGVIQDGWNWMVNVLSKFKNIFQNGFIKQLTAVTNMFSGIVDSINLALDGEWALALANLGTTLGVAFLEISKNLVNFVLDTVGSFFGLEEGELGSIISDSINSIINWVKDGWQNLKDFFIIEIPQWFVDTKDWIFNKFKEIFNGIKESIIQKFDELGISEKISGAILAIKDRFNKIIKGFTDMINYIVGIPARVKDYIISIMPDWLKTNESKTGSFVPNKNSAREMFFKGLDSGLNPPIIVKPSTGDEGLFVPQIKPRNLNTARTIDQTAPAPSKGAGGLVISQDNRTSVTTNNESTNIMSWSNPMGDYNPY